MPEEQIYLKVFKTFQKEIEKKALMASIRARSFNVYIPTQNFNSYFHEAIWTSIRDYLRNSDVEYGFQQIVKHRIHYAEVHAWRDYQNTSNYIGKRRTQYISGQTKPLNLKQQNSYNSFEILHINIQIDEFTEHQPVDGIIIKMLAAGSRPREISEFLFDSGIYTSRYRKRISRARKNFKRYLEN
ncbi:hypothetical protein [Lactiplantibacillus plantarum]|uniref:hypothetical protein n=1 Tax=Lactiplantibacillus plantarum TaxID=1590 RepID=UPI0020010C35|nr:hypothetical protein [Lactiplantibacillus plantarum]